MVRGLGNSIPMVLLIRFTSILGSVLLGVGGSSCKLQILHSEKLQCKSDLKLSKTGTKTRIQIWSEVSINLLFPFEKVLVWRTSKYYIFVGPPNKQTHANIRDIGIKCLVWKTNK